MAQIPEFSADQVQAFMDEALVEARRAGELGEVPIGAVVVYNNQVIARGHNLRETDQLATAHAEILAIEAANRALGSWRLENTALFVTLEPCIMCAGAIINARIPAVYFGAVDPKAGATVSLYQLLADQRLNHQVQVVSGVAAEESGALLQDFFRQIRAARKAAKAAKLAADDDDNSPVK
ncbi:tRNA adenosine(34) deaminase TadA [Lactobacillaceae bacterium L1_55_11]|nr:tRNA adenosine(34) deaminase TadA [Lactobacillaceae bacterium L1_55_11]